MEKFKRSLAGAVRDGIDDALDQVSRDALAPIQNPPEGDDGGVEEDDEEDDDDESLLPLAFVEETDADAACALAAAAWRMFGGEGDVVAVCTARRTAYCGPLDSMDEWAEDVGMSNEEWEFYEDSQSILRLPTDVRGFKAVLRDVDRETLQEAREDFKDFHWGQPADVTEIKAFDGLTVTAPISRLGLAHELVYWARKDGKVEPYTHEFGEESGERPQLYRVGDRILLIHGGDMRVEADGIRD